MVEESNSRFSGAPWFEHMRYRCVTVFGAGGIGSWAALAFARLGIREVDISDDDRIDLSNLGGQNYSMYNVGELKSNVLAKEIIFKCQDCRVFAYGNRNATTRAYDYICGVDNMESRNILFDNWLQDRMSEIFMDGRLSAEGWQIFCLFKDDTDLIEEYKEKYLFADSEAERTICSYKQTTFAAMQIGGFMAQIYVNKICEIRGIRDVSVPLMLEFNGPTLHMRTI